MILTLLLLPFAFILPALIVIFWRRRPVIAFLLAATVLFLSLSAPGLIQTLQAMMIYGTDDPELMAGGISVALIGAMYSLIIGLPILAFIQWIARRNYKKPVTKKETDDIFQ